MAKFMKTLSYEKLLDPEDRDDCNTSLDEKQPDSRINTLRTPFFISSTALTILILLLTVALHFRFQPTPPAYPITLAPITNEFTTNPSLHPFDLATQETWKSLIPPGWSGIRAQSPSGGSLVAGIDMYHKLHCLTSIRQEFTALVTDERRWHTFWDEENEVQRLHWGHCFDFIRQVSKRLRMSRRVTDYDRISYVQQTRHLSRWMQSWQIRVGRGLCISVEIILF
jgi:hypothetical protein